MKTKLIFIIQAYQTRDDQGRLDDACTIELIDTNVENAIKRAKKLIKKDFYRVMSIIEKEKDGKNS